MDNVMHPDHTIQTLIIHYLEGQASAEELQALEKWISQSDENFVLFQEFRQYWSLTGGNRRFDVEVAWKEVNGRLQKTARRFPFGLRITGWAAAVVLLISLGFYFYRLYTPASIEVVADSSIGPGSNKAILVLGSNERVELNDRLQEEWKDACGVVKKQGNTLVYEGESSGVEEEFNRLITPRGGEYTVILSDGTKVWLNAESELRYPVHFNGQERKVYLKGEAYFSVTKQEDHTFVVCSDNTCIKVLGTEFNVRRYEEEYMEATLVKGSVVVVRENGEESRLIPGQQAIVRKEGTEVREVETILYTAWKDGYFVYRDKTLDDILKELSRWYDFTYFYQNSTLEQLTLTAKLRKFDRVEKIFEVLSETGEVEFTTQGKTVIVKAK